MQFNWQNPYPTIRSPLMARNVVSTSHPLASQAGLRMLLKGGNAIDAAIAAAAALTIVEPVSNGLGSDNFAILWDGKELHGLNSSGVAPAAWNPAYFKSRHGETMPERGWDSVTTPGAVAGWVALSKRFGKLPFADLLEPAIELAERGHSVACIVADKWARQVPNLQDKPGFAEAFMPRGRAPLPGERFVFKAAGQTLRKIAATKGEAFYRGEIAEALVGAQRCQRRQHDAGRSGRLSPRVGHADPEGLRRLHGARDPAQRPGHRRADGAGHARQARPGAVSRSTASSRSICRSRPSSWRSPTPTAGSPTRGS